MLRYIRAAAGAVLASRRSVGVGSRLAAGRGFFEPMEARVMLSGSPFGGTAVVVTPSGGTTVQAENFDVGGETSGGLFSGGYHDTDAGDIFGSLYRSPEGVDVFDSAAAHNGHAVGWVKQGEFLNFTVNVQQTGDYALSLRAASVGAGGSFSMNLDSAVAVGSVMNVPDTGGWTTFQDVSGGTVHLTAGTHTLTLFANSAVQANGYMANLDSFTLTGPSGPFGGSAVVVAPTGATTVQAENFNEGGETSGLLFSGGYHDTDPGNIFGSSFRAGTSVDIFDSAGAQNGHAIGWVKQGEFLNFTVNVQQTGDYALSLRAASVGAGGSFQMNLDSALAVGGLINVPDTGGWTTFQDVSGGTVHLTAGTHTLTLFATSAVQGNGYMANLDSFTLTGPASAPFGGTAVVVGPTGSTTVQAENFNEGGESSGGLFAGGYHDTDPGNIFGSSYRAGTNVDIFDSGAAQNSHAIGWVKQGEFLNFTVNVQQTGDYNLSLRAASVGAGGSFQMNLDSAVAVGSVMNVPDTGGWTTFQDVSGGTVHLTAGTHTLTLFANSAVQANGYMANLDSFTLTGPASAPYGGTAVAVASTGATTVQAENFNEGGETTGVVFNGGYHDTDAGNIFGSSYRPGTDVDIFDDAAAAQNGHAIGWVKQGEFLNYTVNVQQTGDYTLALRAASVGAGGSFSMNLDSAVAVGSVMNVPDTGGWTTFQNVSGGTVHLTAGTHTLTLFANSAIQSNGYMANLDSFTLTAV